MQYNLQSEGFSTSVAADGESALYAVDDQNPDLVMLDWMIPGTSGIEVCRQIRQSPHHRTTPVIMLTARGEEADRIRGLDSGADDYVVKPFSPSELMSRVRAVFRRTHPERSQETLTYADISMDLATHRVMRNGGPIRLGPTEFRLLRALLEKPERVFSR